MRFSGLFAAGLITVGLTALAPSAAFAGDQDFTLVNKTGYQIDYVYVSAVNAKSWGGDIMGKDALADDASVNITFHNDTTACKFDLKVTYNDKTDASWGNIDLCTVSKVTLFWNAKTQTSTATVE
jgi:hypothetical protein